MYGQRERSGIILSLVKRDHFLPNHLLPAHQLGGIEDVVCANAIVTKLEYFFSLSSISNGDIFDLFESSRLSDAE